jgi:hypothetical protein
MRYVPGSSGFDFSLVSSLTKGIFITRKSSEGLGRSDQELAELSNPANRKRLPTIAEQASQVAILFLVGRAVRRGFSNKELSTPDYRKHGGWHPNLRTVDRNESDNRAAVF